MSKEERGSAIGERGFDPRRAQSEKEDAEISPKRRRNPQRSLIRGPLYLWNQVNLCLARAEGPPKRVLEDATESRMELKRQGRPSKVVLEINVRAFIRGTTAEPSVGGKASYTTLMASGQRGEVHEATAPMSRRDGPTRGPDT